MADLRKARGIGRPSRMNLKRCAVSGLLLLATACGGAEKGKLISQKQFGEQWSLTVPSSRVSYISNSGRGQVVAFIAPGGKKYSLNGTASGSGKFFPIESNLLPDPKETPPPKFCPEIMTANCKLEVEI
jgi:hypothetical protein